MDIMQNWIDGFGLLIGVEKACLLGATCIIAYITITKIIMADEMVIRFKEMSEYDIQRAFKEMVDELISNTTMMKRFHTR